MQPVNENKSLDMLALQQATEWFVALKGLAQGEPEYAQWRVWINAHPLHQAAWQEVQNIQASFDQLASYGDHHAAKKALLSPRAMSRRGALKALGFGGMAIFSGYLAKQYSPWRDWITNVVANNTGYQVAVGETRLFTLSEGTKLWLNTNSKVNVAYSIALRRVTLEMGELLIESAKDHALPNRPLVVDTMHGRIVALGTRFIVRLNGNRTFVAVFDGAVSVTPAHGQQAVTIQSGQQLEFTDQQWSPVQTADQSHQAWTRGMLVADNRRLDDFIADLSRYRSGKLLVSNDIGHLKLVGAYPLRDTDHILASITEVLPVRLKHINATDIQLIKR